MSRRTGWLVNEPGEAKLAVEIAHALDRLLGPHGIAVVVDPEQPCLATPGVRAPAVMTRTRHLLEAFPENEERRRDFSSLVPRA